MTQKGPDVRHPTWSLCVGMSGSRKAISKVALRVWAEEYKASSVQTRGIVKTSGFTSRICKNWRLDKIQRVLYCNSQRTGAPEKIEIPPENKKENQKPTRISPKMCVCVFFWASPFTMHPVCTVLLRTPRPDTEPRDGTQNFLKKYRKNTLRADILEPWESTPKISKTGISGYFFDIWGYFGGIFWESRISARGGISSVLFCGNFSWGHLGAL